MSQIYSQVTQNSQHFNTNKVNEECAHWEGEQGGQEGTRQSGSGATKPHLRALPTTLAWQKRAAAEEAEGTQRTSSTSASTSHGAWFLPFFLGKILKFSDLVLCLERYWYLLQPFKGIREVTEMQLKDNWLMA